MLRSREMVQERSRAGKGYVVGGAIGAGAWALLALVVGSYFGRAGEFVGMGAAVGGTSGGMTEVVEGAKSQMDIIRRCMFGGIGFCSKLFNSSGYG